MTLGERLKYNRTKADLTQREVNKKTGINYKTLSNWENDVSKPSPDDLIILANTYNVTTDYLLGLSDQPQGTGFQKGLLGNAPLGQKAPNAKENPSYGLSIQGDLVKIDDIDVYLHPKSAEKVKKAIELALYDELKEARGKAQPASKSTGPIINNQPPFTNGILTSMQKQKIIYCLEASIMMVDGLHCDGIKEVDMESIDLVPLIANPLIGDMLDEQEKESKTYLVPEMFHMKSFIDSLRNHILHYNDNPQNAVWAFKESCVKYLNELRTLMYDTMYATDEQLEGKPRKIMGGMEYCVINNDLYRMEKNGPGRYILTKQSRPTYDPTPKGKTNKAEKYGYAA